MRYLARAMDRYVLPRWIRPRFTVGAAFIAGLASITVACVLLSFTSHAGAIAPGLTVRVSTDSSGTQGNAGSGASSISADGRYVAFHSEASNLVAGDTNGMWDVFVRDTVTGAVQRVSIDASGAEGNAHSESPSVSADGRYVAFYSSASNLVAGDTNGRSDIFVKDTLTGAVQRVSTDSSGGEGNDYSEAPSISADGRHVAFASYASDLVAGDTNDICDVFVKDTSTGAIQLVSADSSGAEGDVYSYTASISADGRYVAFHSEASNLVAGDTNGESDVFVKDTTTGAIQLVSADSSGTEGNAYSLAASISADGRYVAFQSEASNLVAGDTNGEYDIFVKDTTTGAIQLVSADTSGAEGDFWSQSPSISADGRYVAFSSPASNFIAGDTNGEHDVFVKDTATGAIQLISTDTSGAAGDSYSQNPAISADGWYVAFESMATNLVTGDTNEAPDTFLRDTIARDITPPQTTISALPSGWVNSDVAFSLTATDVTSPADISTYYGLNAAAVTTYSAEVTVTAEGATTIAFRSVDVHGNAEATKTATVRIDKSAPSTADDHVAKYITSATIHLTPADTMSGVANTTWTLDGAPGSGRTVTTSVLGAHTLAYRSVDVANNAEEMHTVNFSVVAPPKVATRLKLSSASSVRRKKTLTATAIISPKAAPGTVKFSFQRKVGRTWRKVKTVSVKLSGGKAVYKYKPATRGTWRFVVSYPGKKTASAVYLASSATRGFRVK